jgi:hypothetical protein
MSQSWLDLVFGFRQFRNWRVTDVTAGMAEMLNEVVSGPRVSIRGVVVQGISVKTGV